MISELVTLGRRIQANKTGLWDAEVERLYLSPAHRAHILAALWAMAQSDADGCGDGELVDAYDKEAAALDEAGSASLRAHALWYETLPLEEPG
jgi:hypothetical protein